MPTELPRYLRIGVQLGVLLTVIFTGFILYAMRAAPQMLKESNTALDAFYLRCKNHDYARAYELCAPELRDSLSQADLADRWTQFEKINGRIQKWDPALGGGITFGGRTNFIPPFVDYTHRVTGEKPSDVATATVVYIRMVPREGQWELQKLSFMR